MAALQPGDIISGNNFLNVFDPPKDAAVKFTVTDPTGADTEIKLTEADHGSFLIGIYRTLYYANRLPPASLLGIGKRTAQMENYITQLYGGFPVRQQFTALTFGGPQDMRLPNMNFGIDVGYTLATIGGKGSKAILTPGSVIDPGPRQMNYPPSRVINTLDDAQQFSFTQGGFYGLLQMEKFM